MKKDIHLIIIGGTGRNVGKTEFVCRLISRVSNSYDVYALKVSAMFPDELLYHGDHSGIHSEMEGSSQLFEETRIDSPKDTSRILFAGARRVFFLRSEENGIGSAYEDFRKIIPPQSVVVCESNSLDTFVCPGLRVMVKTADGVIKKRAVSRLQKADIVVVSDGESGFPELDRIQYTRDYGWEIIS